MKDDSLPGVAADEAVIELLLERVETSESAEARATLLTHVAHLYETQLGDADRAFTALLAAELEREHDTAVAELERLADRTGRWRDLADHVGGRLSTLAATERVEACAWLAWICLDRLHEPERALVAAAAALAIESGHERAISVRIAALRTLDRPAELIEALGAVAAQSWDAERRVALLVEQAGLLIAAGDARRAQEACRAALTADPRAAAARELLERLVRQSGDLDELVQLLDRKADEVGADDALAVGRESAAHCVALGRTDEAIRRYEAIRAVIPADLDTLWALERLYAAAHARDHLLVLEALAGAVADEGEQLALHRRLAAGWEQLGEHARAADALEWVIASDGGNDKAFAKLAALYLASGHWRGAVVAITRRIERSEAPARAGLYVELGNLFEEHAEDSWRALDYYERANEVGPGNEATLVALARLYEQTGAYERAARCLEAAAAIAKTGNAKAGRLARGAELLLADRDDARVKWAERMLREALEVQPGYPPAARALAPLLLERGEERSAADLLHGGVANAADDDERADLLLEAGKAEEALGEEERALSCYRRALEADPSRREAQLHASEMLYRLGFDHELIPLLERLCEDEPDAAVRADRLVRLARVYDAVGDRRRALEAVHHAQAVVTGHFQARRVEGELLFSEGRWLAARQIFEAVFAEGGGLSARELANVQARIGACAIALADEKAGLAALEQALLLNPDHLVALKRSLELYAEKGRWLEALAAAERIAVIEPEKKLRARYRAIAGRICMDELSVCEDAVAHYRHALEEDPELDDASRALERVLSVQGDNEGLVAHYTHRIQQLSDAGNAADAERVRLWAALADACELMGDRDAHRIALEVAIRLDGSKLELRERYADACAAAGPFQLDRAISEHHEIVAREKGRVSSYLALAELYARTGQALRAAGCRHAAAAIVRLGLATGPSVEVPAEVPAEETPIAAKRPLAAQDWQQLRHGDEDPPLSALWARIAPILATLEAAPDKALGLRARDAVAHDDGRPFAVACREAARLLGVADPTLHVRQDQREAVRFLNLRAEHALTPTFVIGMPFLGDRRRVSDLLFPIAMRLANLSAERMLCLALPDPAALAVIIEAVIALSREADGKGTAAWSRIGQTLRQHLTPVGFDQAVMVGRVLCERGDDSTALAKRWLRGAELTAARAAMVMTGDLHGAIRVLAGDDQASYAEPGERMLDLIWFSVTDAFFGVRARVTDLPIAAQPERGGTAKRPRSQAS
jgi:tetratricopeptide (TPR) repeat protein